MKERFIYLVAEGVIDVVFIGEVLRACFGGEVVGRRSSLPQEAALWLGQFKWPAGDDIARKAVPAPAFVRCGGRFIAMRNAQGISGIRKTLDADMEAFLRMDWRPEALCIVLDADGEQPADRFDDFAGLLSKTGYPRPVALDSLHEADGLRAGVFAFPGGGRRGTLEDVLLPLAARRFPALARYAEEYAGKWERMLATEREDALRPEDFRELRRPAGKNKAILSSMTALLKPGKSIIASIEDQGWIPEKAESREALAPFTKFLRELLRDTAP